MKPYGEMEEKKKILGECVTFYNKSIDIFMGNVQDKFRSLVDNIDFSQLWSIHTINTKSKFNMEADP